MDSLAGRQLMPHSLSDVMHQADTIFSHTGTLATLASALRAIDQQQYIVFIMYPLCHLLLRCFSDLIC